MVLQTWRGLVLLIGVVLSGCCSDLDLWLKLNHGLTFQLLSLFLDIVTQIQQYSLIWHLEFFHTLPSFVL